ncbi:MAG: amidohydrolase family protein [Candidatus Adiutrix sp.]|jgi:predicted TIM-barrel fold metal-dependent hydrolase|nr:amidohydrolase family protein [Candidatus Adiutrix sp.]
MAEKTTGTGAQTSETALISRRSVMKLIMLEEHATDPAITEATKHMLHEAAPYILDFDPTRHENAQILENLDQNRIADMDANGIDIQVISLSNYPQLLSSEEAVPLCRAANERLAAAVKKYPDRFAAFASLPLSNPAAAAAELERTVTAHGFKGALILGRPGVGPVFLDDPRYMPVLAKAGELQVPLYLHPGFPQRDVQNIYYAGLNPVVTVPISTYGWGWHNEAGIQVLRLILSGAFDTIPGLTVIAGHWGEMVPFFLDRLDAALPKDVTGLKRTIIETFRDQIYVTPSGMFTMPHFMFIMDVLGADRILYSVDYPYHPNGGARGFLETAPISQTDREKIAHRNAERLLRL